MGLIGHSKVNMGYTSENNSWKAKKLISPMDLIGHSKMNKIEAHLRDCLMEFLER